MIVSTFAAGLICQALTLAPKHQFHPDEGEILSFDYTNADAGALFMNDEKEVYFPFTNHSGHDVFIEKITCNNPDSLTPFFASINIQNVIKNGQRDSIKFDRVSWVKLPERLYDNSWTIHYKDLQTKQYLNIFCELKINRGQLHADPVVLDTVERGKDIRFSAPITNQGDNAVTIQKPEYLPAGLMLHNNYPVKIEPGETGVLEFQIPTTDLLNYYTGSVYFDTNEEGRYPRFKIQYSGQLISKNHASIRFDSLEKSLFIIQGDPAYFDFWFTNNGDEPLIIAMCKTSCGCLVASWPKEPIKPGDRNVIKITYDTNRVGPINKTCTVTSNAAETNVVLRVKGDIKAKPEVAGPVISNPVTGN
jgi:hypothetical protein